MEEAKKISREVRVGIVLFALSGILFLISPEKVILSIRQNIPLAGKIIGLTFITAILSVFIDLFLTADYAQRHLSGNKTRYFFYASLFGILTPGPVYAIYPLIRALKKKGIKNAILVSYITGQTIIGPARFPLEVGLFGLKFFVYRLILAIFMAPMAGFLYLLISRKFKDSREEG